MHMKGSMSQCRLALHWLSAFPFLAHLQSPSMSSKRSVSSLFHKLTVRQLVVGAIVDCQSVMAQHGTVDRRIVDVTKWFIAIT